MKLTVHLISWNGEKYIPYLFASLRQQTFKDWSLLVVDNASKDGTVSKIKKELENFPVEYKIIENKENLGFSPGHNQAYRDTNGEYFLILNQDMYLSPDCLEKMVEYLAKNLDVAAVSPRLMRWDFAKVGEGLEKSLSDQVDSLGLKIFRNRRVVEQYTAEKWSEIKNKLEKTGDVLSVFGVSGAFPMFRRSAIKAVEFAGGQFLDEAYHSYKEDVDLAYRLAEAGFKAHVLLDTVAHHDRSAVGLKDLDDRAAIANHQSQSEWVKYHSYKNHLRTLIKNEYWQNFILDFPWILWYELKKLGYLALFDHKALSGLRELWKTRQDLLNKRKLVNSYKKVTWQDLRQWWK